MALSLDAQALSDQTSAHVKEDTVITEAGQSYDGDSKLSALIRMIQMVQQN